MSKIFAVGHEQIVISILLLYSHQCSPCLIPYDAIVKLEESGEEEYLLSWSGLSEYVSSKDLPTWIHHTHGGPTPEHREEFFTDVPCSLLQELTQHFLMDLEMFQYDTKEFLTICKK